MRYIGYAARYALTVGVGLCWLGGCTNARTFENYRFVESAKNNVFASLRIGQPMTEMTENQKPGELLKPDSSIRQVFRENPAMLKDDRFLHGIATPVAQPAG